MELSKLPDELFHVLFGYFDLPTLLTKCCLVSKRWRALVHQMRIKELYIEYYPNNEYSNYPLCRRYSNFWSYPVVPLDSRYWVSVKTTTFFDFPFINMFEGLRRLKVPWSLGDDFDFSELSQFRKLDQLVISVSLSSAHKTIQLPGLKVLSLHFDLAPQSKLTVDCPQLEVLLFRVKDSVGPYEEMDDQRGSLNFVHPEAPERIAFIGEKFDFDFSQFKSVRILYYLDATSPLRAGASLFDSDLLQIFPNLEELHYGDKYQGLTAREINEAVDRFLEKKTWLKRDLKVFCIGIELKESRLFHSLKVSHKNSIYNEELQCKNYELITENVFYLDYLYYHIFEENFGNSLPADLAKKFPCLNTIWASKPIKHLDQFALFLKKCGHLCELIIEIGSVDQNFCNQLTNCHFLRRLSFRQDKQGDRIPKLDYNFLKRLTNLVVFEALDLDIDLAVELIKTCPKIEFLSFYYADYENHIFKTNRSLYCFRQNFFHRDEIQMSELLSIVESIKMNSNRN